MDVPYEMKDTESRCGNGPEAEWKGVNCKGFRSLYLNEEDAVIGLWVWKFL